MHAEVFKHAIHKPHADTARNNHRQNYLTNAATFGHTGHKQGHTWGIGNPPQPVKHRPFPRELAIAKRVGKQAHVDKIGGHQTQTVDGVVHDELGRAKHQYIHCEQDHAITHKLAQALHAVVHADVRTQGKHHRYQQDDDHFGGKRVRYAREQRQDVGEGHGGQDQGNGQGAKHAQHKQQVHGTTDHASGFVTSDRFHHGRQTQTFVLAHMVVVAHGNGGQGVNAPSTGAIMEKGIGDTEFQGFR